MIEKWIFASVSTHFKNIIHATVPMFVEGEDQKYQDLPQYMEFRLNGPIITPYSGTKKYEIVTNLLVVCKQVKTSIFPIHERTSLAVSACTNGIPIYKYGEPGNPYLGCMKLSEHENRSIIVSHIGQIEPDTKEMQSLVQAYYKMFLETN